jgi:hypothetical protein
VETIARRQAQSRMMKMKTELRRKQELAGVVTAHKKTRARQNNKKKKMIKDGRRPQRLSSELLKGLSFIISRKKQT